MKRKIRYIIILFFCVISVSLLKAQSVSDTKKIKKSFKVGTTTNIEVQNKYGKIQVIPHDKDSAIFEITIIAKAESHNEVKKMIANVDFDFTQTSFYIGAKTILGTGRKGILSDIKLLKENFVSENNQIKINYTLYVPHYISLSVENKYGDVYVDNLKGDFKLNLSNGDLKANNLTGTNDLELKFCNNIDINKITTGRIDIAYTELHIKEATNLTITSKSSSLVIDKVAMLKIKSKSDKYYITNATNFYGDTYFTDVNLTELEKELSITTRYGNLNIERIDKTFDFINVNSKITDLNLFFQQGSAYRIDVTHKENTLNFPTDISNLKRQTINKNEEQYLTHGTIGGATGNSKVKIEGERSTINIIHK